MDVVVEEPVSEEPAPMVVETETLEKQPAAETPKKKRKRSFVQKYDGRHDPSVRPKGH